MINRMPRTYLNYPREAAIPAFFSELAESFGMMLVKVEAREFRLKEIIEELEETKMKLEQEIATHTAEGK